MKHLIEQTAKTTGETTASVENVTSFMARFTADEIASGRFQNIRWPLLGCFQVNQGMIRAIIHRQSATPVITAKDNTP